MVGRGGVQLGLAWMQYGLVGLLTGAPEPATVTVWTVPGAGHTDGLARDPEGRERTVIAFLDGAYAAAPSG